MSHRDPQTPGSATGSADSPSPATGVTEPVTWQNDDYVDPGLAGDTNLGGKAQDQAAAMVGKAQDRAGELAGKAQEMGGVAQDKADAGMDKAATGLDQAAGMLRSQGSQHEGAIGTAATRTADTLESASHYLREKNTDQLVDDIETFVRKRPVESVLIAAGVGYLLSRVVR